MAGGTTIRELVTRLGFDIDDEKLDTFERRVSRVKTGLISLTAVSAAAAVGLIAMVKHAADTGEELQAASDLVGLSVESYQQYAMAANLAEVSTEEFQTALQFLNRNVGQAIAGNKELQKTFSKLGFSLTDLKNTNTEQLLDRLHQRFSAIQSPAERAALSVALFGRSGLRMGRFLSQSQEQFEETNRIVRMFGFYTAEAAAAGDEMGDRWMLVGTVMKGISNAIGISLFPMFTKLANVVLKWVQGNEKLIHGKLDTFVTKLTKTLSFLWLIFKKVAGAVEFLIKAMGGLENAVALVGSALAAIGGAAVVGALQAVIALVAALGLSIGTVLLETVGIPLLIAAGIFALILAVQDLYTWIEGGDSVIGSWLGSWVTFKEKALEQMHFVVEGITVIFGALKEFFVGLWDFLAGGWGSLVAIWKGDVDGFVKNTKRALLGLSTALLKAPVELVFGIVETVLAALSQLIVGAVKVMVALVTAAIPPSLIKFMNWTGDKLGAIGGGVHDFVGGMTTNPAAPGMGGMGYDYSGLTRPSATNGAGRNEVNVTAQVTVPPGTSEQQASFIEKSMEAVAEKIFGRHLDHAMQNNPRQQ